MGFFSKLFNNKKGIYDITQLSPSSEMMQEEIYWNLIAKSLKNTKTQEEQLGIIKNKLENLSPREIIGFRLRTDKLLHDTYTSEMWCAGYLMMDGCSDDVFEYFRNWIISGGKDVYYAAKENPDTLAVFDGESGDFDFEDFWYVANDAFANKTAADLYDYIDNENFTTKEGNYPNIVFNWDEETPASMKEICPKLYEKFWKE